MLRVPDRTAPSPGLTANGRCLDWRLWGDIAAARHATDCGTEGGGPVGGDIISLSARQSPT
jgi:hypothetical protein